MCKYGLFFILKILKFVINQHIYHNVIIILQLKQYLGEIFLVRQRKSDKRVSSLRGPFKKPSPKRLLVAYLDTQL